MSIMGESLEIKFQDIKRFGIVDFFKPVWEKHIPKNLNEKYKNIDLSGMTPEEFYIKDKAVRVDVLNKTLDIRIPVKDIFCVLSQDELNDLVDTYEIFEHVQNKRTFKMFFKTRDVDFDIHKITVKNSRFTNSTFYIVIDRPDLKNCNLIPAQIIKQILFKEKELDFLKSELQSVDLIF